MKLSVVFIPYPANLYDKILTLLGFTSVQIHSTPMHMKDTLRQTMQELEANKKGRYVRLMFEKNIGLSIVFAIDYDSLQVSYRKDNIL